MSITITLSVQEKTQHLKDIMLELMKLDYTLYGRNFNLFELGWEFEFSQHEQANGQCTTQGFGNVFFSKKLMLSEWLIHRLDRTIDVWIDIMLHEIAHALDIETRGVSSHDDVWRDIALSIGCSGEISTTSKFLGSVNEKYLYYCDSCDNEQHSTKLDVNILNGNTSCGVCSPNNFSYDYIIKWKENPNYNLVESI